MPRFSASFFLAVLATSFLSASAAPVQISNVATRAAANADFQAACDAGGVAGSLVGNAATLLASIQTTDQNLLSQLAAVKGVLDATSNVGAEVAAACKNAAAAGLVSNNGANANANSTSNNNNNNSNNSNSNSNSNTNNQNTQGNQSSSTQASNNANNSNAKTTTIAASTTSKLYPWNRTVLGSGISGRRHIIENTLWFGSTLKLNPQPIPFVDRSLAVTCHHATAFELFSSRRPTRHQHSNVVLVLITRRRSLACPSPPPPATTFDYGSRPQWETARPLGDPSLGLGGIPFKADRWGTLLKGNEDLAVGYCSRPLGDPSLGDSIPRWETAQDRWGILH
ncbi:hypothetical protein DFH06DRAFT_1297798 [Mycena polygramma]|nr:hypothetical protein DFH06DRAFT_1297798 [Mycena polygramma]